jgi:2-keto-4-pentenoate hydratase/2-oxohepta-3-ene-1,7-dioic acid hydratase in catechol pathway
VIGPGEPIVIPRENTETDYEVELAMVIGRPAKRLDAGSALDAVFGWTILDDVSARNVQFKENQITLGKGPDTFCPLGPEVVTADELGDWESLHVSTTLNGETMQSSPTSEMVFAPPVLLAFLTALVTLEPGDVVSTGTPAGVGCFRHPPVYLRPGDEVIVSVDRIGDLTNPVVAGW